MKKIIFSIFASFFLFTLCAFSAPDVDSMTLDRMPTDAEIWKVINQYDFDPAQKDYLFKATKKKLLYMYSQKATMGQALGTAPAQTASETPSTEEVKPKGNGKKYANHDPLTRRSKQLQD